MERAETTIPVLSRPAPTRTWCVYVLWAIALGLLLGLGLFCWLAVMPVIEVRQAVSGLKALNPRSGTDTKKCAVSLGSPKQAVNKIRLYLLSPGASSYEKSLALEILGYVGRPSVPFLVDCLRDDDYYIRRAAAGALAHIGVDAAPAVPLLTKALESRDLNDRCYAASALGAIGPQASQAVPGLIELMNDQCGEVRNCAAMALGEIGVAPRAAIDGLAGLLKDPEKRIRISAAMALGELAPASEPAAGALSAVLADHDPQLVAAAARALARLGIKASPAVPALLSELDSWAPIALEPFFAHRLGSRVPVSFVTLPDAMHAITAVVEALGAIGPDANQAVPTLTKMLAEGENQAEPASGSAETGGDKDIDALFNDWQVGLRHRIIWALGRIADPRAVPALRKTLDDENAYIRQAAAEALKKIKAAQEKCKP
jgi:HEAT repeat protein